MAKCVMRILVVEDTQVLRAARSCERITSLGAWLIIEMGSVRRASLSSNCGLILANLNFTVYLIAIT